VERVWARGSRSCCTLQLQRIQLGRPVSKRVGHHVRVRINRARGLSDDSQTPSGVRHTDSWMQAGVMVCRVDSNSTLWRVVLASEDAGHELCEIVSACTDKCIGQNMRLEVRGLPAKIGNAVFAEAGSKSSQGSPVYLSVNRLEIRRGGEVSGPACPIWEISASEVVRLAIGIFFGSNPASA